MKKEKYRLRRALQRIRKGGAKLMCLAPVKKYMKQYLKGEFSMTEFKSDHYKDDNGNWIPKSEDLPDELNKRFKQGGSDVV